MTEYEPTLNTLLNDDSYIRWLKGYSTSLEYKEWKKWYAASEKHQELTKKAKIFLNMPFKSMVLPQQDVNKKIESLKEKISRLSKKASNK